MRDITGQLYLWIQQITALAQTGLAFHPDTYNRERYEAFLDLAAQMAATINPPAILDPELAVALAQKWRKEVGDGIPGYVTPKVGVGALVFNARNEILLIERAEGGWLFPTGWAEVGMSAAQVAVKEVREETGLLVTPLRVSAVYDSAKWSRGLNLNLHFYSIEFYCRLDGGELKPHPVETRGAGFFARDKLPAPLNRRGNWIEHAWAVHRGESVEAYFDQ